MPATDLLQTIKSAVEKNLGIPAILDAYSQFVDSPIGELEISNLDSVFLAILENLKSRYPLIASQKAADTARNDISAFLVVSNKNPERVKQSLKVELSKGNQSMALSISERFSRANPEEKKAIDATLRVLRRSNLDIMFRAELGNPISSAGIDFDRFFSAIRAESGIKELRYQNLIVEKGLFNKLILKSTRQDYQIWIPSFFAKENVDDLIGKTGVQAEHVLLSRLKELRQDRLVDKFRPFLESLMQSSGVLSKTESIPEELRDFFHFEGEKYAAMSPLELDDIFLFYREESEAKERESRAVEEKRSAKSLEEKIKRDEEQIQRMKHEADLAPQTGAIRNIPGTIYLGKQLDIEQLISMAPRVSGEEIANSVKAIGDYYTDLGTIRSHGICIVGASGSGRSTSLKRLLDGIGAGMASDAGRIVVLDQKGEHRGIAWKYNWQVFSFKSDQQSMEFKMPFLHVGVGSRENAELLADMIQEWCLQTGSVCSDQDRARIASMISSLDENLSSDTLHAALTQESDLQQIAKKISKDLLARGISSRIFSEEGNKINFEGKLLFDLSGRGLRDPTTREERLLLSVLILKSLEESKVNDAIIVLEDVLDRFKGDSLRKSCLKIISNLRVNGNTIIATSRTQIREFVGSNCLEIVHRLSGEKAVNDEVSGLKISQHLSGLKVAISNLPRGYVIISETVDSKGQTTMSSAVRIEPLQF